MKKLIFGLMFLCAYAHAEEADVTFHVTSGTFYGSFSGTGTLTMGYFVGDGSGLTNVPGDNLGNHIATTTLEMGSYFVNSSSAINGAYYQIAGSTVLAILPGTSNLGIGINAGLRNTSGSNNIFVGVDAGRYNTTGAQNVMMGDNVAYFNELGSSNVILGYNAGGGETLPDFSGTISNSVIVGNQAGAKIENQSVNNILLGYKSGYALSTGDSNVFIGYQAGDLTTTGSNNIIIGYDIDAPAATTSNYLNIGGLINGIIGSSSVTVKGALYADNGFYGSGSGLTSVPISSLTGYLSVSSVTVNQVWFSDSVNVSSETTAALGGGIRVSTNVYIVGFSSAAKYYGDASALTSVPGDNLGNHIATTTLQMGDYGIAGSSLSAHGASGQSLYLEANGSVSVYADANNNDTDSYINFGFNKLGLAGDTKLSIKQDGKVGINTYSPTDTLSVHGNIVSTGTVTGTFFYGNLIGNADSATKVTGTMASTQVAAGVLNSVTSLTASSATITGNAFSVGGSTLVVSGGKVGISGQASRMLAPLSVWANIASTTTYGAPRLQIGQNSDTGQYATIGFGYTEPGGYYPAEIGYVATGNANYTLGDLVFATRSTDPAIPIPATEKMRILSGGNVGIGTTTPSALLSIAAGAAWSKINAGDATWTYSSSKDLKANIKYLTPDCAKFFQLKPAQYNFKINKSSDTYTVKKGTVTTHWQELSPVKYGLIAEDVHAIYSEQPANEINGNFIQAQMINAIIDLEKRLAALEAKK